MGYKPRSDTLKGRLIDVFFHRLFSYWERMGFHLTKNHFYQPIPDTRGLKDEIWLRESELVGVDINEEGQLQLLEEFLKFKNEYDALSKRRRPKPWDYDINNSYFGPVDAEILYCMIRYLKPKRIIEIGSGNSTLVSAKALLKNGEEDGHEGKLVSIEPYPDDVLRAGFPGFSRSIEKKVEEVPVSYFLDLGQNDILFIDSSHNVKIGNDVQYEYLEILPRLNKGVMIHLHDIFIPYEYPKEWVLEKHRFWNEQYLLQAFLSFNDAFEVMWAGHYMHRKHPGKLRKAFRSYEKMRDFAEVGSFWMRKTR